MSVQKAINVLLAGALVVAVLLHLVDPRDHTRRNYEFLPDMVESRAYRAFGPNPNFPDGMTLRRPPPGTVARGLLPLFSGEVRLDIEREWKDLPKEQQAAWLELAPPWPWESLDDEAKAAVLARGEQLYRAFCSACHGTTGLGDAPVTKRGVPPPPSFLLENALELEDVRMFRIITSGQVNMSSYASQIDRNDRWKVVRYIRKLQGR